MCLFLFRLLAGRLAVAFSFFCRLGFLFCERKAITQLYLPSQFVILRNGNTLRSLYFCFSRLLSGKQRRGKHLDHSEFSFSLLLDTDFAKSFSLASIRTACHFVFVAHV